MIYPYVYTVTPAPGGVSPLEHDFDSGPWAGAEPIAISQVMGDPEAHRPVAAARMMYDSRYLYASFRVQDAWVIAASPTPATVCRDSCVELFLSPGPTTDAGYFNIECGCGGMILLRHQRLRGVGMTPIPDEVVREMDVRVSLPPRVDPEIPGPVTWTARYRVPLAALAAVAPVVSPAPGVRWRANLYKCADGSSHPHWLTWSPVDRERPDFHRPEYFGVLSFA